MEDKTIEQLREESAAANLALAKAIQAKMKSHSAISSFSPERSREVTERHVKVVSESKAAFKKQSANALYRHIDIHSKLLDGLNVEMKQLTDKAIVLESEHTSLASISKSIAKVNTKKLIGEDKKDAEKNISHHIASVSKNKMAIAQNEREIKNLQMRIDARQKVIHGFQKSKNDIK